MVEAADGSAALGQLQSRRPDLVLCDYLVHPAALEHVSASAEVIRLGHHSTGRDMTPDEIVESFLMQFYEDATDIPQEVLLAEETHIVQLANAIAWRLMVTYYNMS